jgi:hypothetical protein
MEKANVTKRTVLSAIDKYVAAHDDFEVTVDGVVVTAEDVDAYVTTTIEQIDKKNEKAKERNAQKKAEGDALRATIAGLLTDTPQTIADIMAQIDDPEVTPAKVTARLTQLRKAGEAYSVDVKVDSRKVKAYAAGEAPTDVTLGNE